MGIKTFFCYFIFNKREIQFNKKIMVILSDKNIANKQWLCLFTAADKVQQGAFVQG